MRIRRVTVAVLTALVLPLTAACEGSDNQSSDTDSSASEGKDGGDSKDGNGDGDDSDGNSDGDGAGEELPNLVGQGMKSAHDAAKEAGFSKITIHDALGRDRAQAVVRNWKTCFQKPAAGKHPSDTEVDLGVVKTDEDCPDEDQRPEAAESAFPDFTGKSLRAARNALDGDASIKVEDATDENRVILLESNWKICTQDPKAGTKVNGQPVTLKAVKFDEKCP